MLSFISDPQLYGVNKELDNDINRSAASDNFFFEGIQHLNQDKVSIYPFNSHDKYLNFSDTSK